jgi:hypothetical protein
MTSTATAQLLKAVGARRLEPHHQLRGHDFFPPAAELATVPALYATEDVHFGEKVVYLHYFAAGSDWWICELDPRTGLAFGYACHNDPDNAEWGYIDLNELCSLVIPVAPPVIVERDLHWRATPVHQCALPGRRAS